MSFCSEIGFSSVVLIGHDDGGLLALKAAQKAQSLMSSFNVCVSFLFVLFITRNLNELDSCLVEPRFYL